MTTVTRAGMKALRNAARREGGYVCPIHGVRAAAQAALLNRLRRDGLITFETAPRITDIGRRMLDEEMLTEETKP